MPILPLSPSNPDPDVEGRWADALAEFDERLRNNGPTTLAVEVSHAEADMAQADAGLRECLTLLEAAWPRTERAAENLADHWPDMPRQIGRFRIQRLLGGGGFSLVYLADDPALNRRVALKVPRPHMLFQEDLRKRFLFEAQAIGALDHPHIVPVYETGEIGPAVYLAMAYCEGPHLGAWLADQQGNVEARLAAKVVADLAGAISYSHGRGILHRDLKPANVLLFPIAGDASTRDRNEFAFVPKLADFGLAKLLESALEDTRSSIVLGTPLYMAPEQASGGTTAIGPWTDVYGLGAILYEMLAGRPPFTGANVLEVIERLRDEEPPSLAKLRPDLPRDIVTICHKCLAKEGSFRYASANALQEDLQRFLEEQPIVARPLGIFSLAARITNKRTRPHDAGVYAIVMNSVLLLWVVQGTVVAMAGFSIPVQIDATAGFMIANATVLTLHVVPIWLGFKILRGNAWAALTCAILAASTAVMCIAYIAGVIPNSFGGAYNDSLLRLLVFGLVTVLVETETVLCWLAYRVLKRGRR